MRLRERLGHPALYLAWLGVSAAVLLVSWHVDPYVLAFTAIGAGAMSGLLGFVSLFSGPRAILLAVVAAIPSGAAFLVLSTYRWA